MLVRAQPPLHRTQVCLPESVFLCPVLTATFSIRWARVSHAIHLDIYKSNGPWNQNSHSGRAAKPFLLFVNHRKANSLQNSFLDKILYWLSEGSVTLLSLVLLVKHHFSNSTLWLLWKLAHWTIECPAASLASTAQMPAAHITITTNHNYINASRHCQKFLRVAKSPPVKNLCFQVTLATFSLIMQNVQPYKSPCSLPLACHGFGHFTR